MCRHETIDFWFSKNQLNNTTNHWNLLILFVCNLSEKNMNLIILFITSNFVSDSKIHWTFRTKIHFFFVLLYTFRSKENTFLTQQNETHEKKNWINSE